MIDFIAVQTPAVAAKRLILLFHGVDSNPETLLPLGQSLAAAFPTCTILSVRSPDPGDRGTGSQWFSVRGVTDGNRAQRVADTMPRFLEAVRSLQAQTGMAPSRTVIVGFSQGAIMALEASQAAESPAACIVAISGRFVRAPQYVPVSTSVHLIHGDADNLITVDHSMAAFDALILIGAAVTIDIIPELGHRLDDRAAHRLIARLRDLGDDL